MTFSGSDWADIVSGKRTADLGASPFGFAPVVHPSYNYSPAHRPSLPGQQISLGSGEQSPFKVPASPAPHVLHKSPSMPASYLQQYSPSASNFPDNPYREPQSPKLHPSQSDIAFHDDRALRKNSRGSQSSASNFPEYPHREPHSPNLHPSQSDVAFHDQPTGRRYSRERQSRERSTSRPRNSPARVAFHLDSDHEDPGFASNSSDSGKVCQHCHHPVQGAAASPGESSPDDWHHVPPRKERTRAHSGNSGQPAHHADHNRREGPGRGRERAFSERDQYGNSRGGRRRLDYRDNQSHHQGEGQWNRKERNRGNYERFPSSSDSHSSSAGTGSIHRGSRPPRRGHRGRGRGQGRGHSPHSESEQRDSSHDTPRYQGNYNERRRYQDHRQRGNQSNHNRGYQGNQNRRSHGNNDRDYQAGNRGIPGNQRQSQHDNRRRNDNGQRGDSYARSVSDSHAIRNNNPPSVNAGQKAHSSPHSFQHSESVTASVEGRTAAKSCNDQT